MQQAAYEQQREHLGEGWGAHREQQLSGIDGVLAEHREQLAALMALYESASTPIRDHLKAAIDALVTAIYWAEQEREALRRVE